MKYKANIQISIEEFQTLTQMLANSYFEVLGEKATRKKTN